MDECRVDAKLDFWDVVLKIPNTVLFVTFLGVKHCFQCIKSWTLESCKLDQTKDLHLESAPE